MKKTYTALIVLWLAGTAIARADEAPSSSGTSSNAVTSAELVPLIAIEDVPLTDAIRHLARQSNLNFQFDPRITTPPADGRSTNQPNVSIRFENVSAQEALLALLDNYNLALVQEPKSKIARITLKDPQAEDPLVSKVIQLKYGDPTNFVAFVKGILSPRSQVMADIRTRSSTASHSFSVVVTMS